MAYLFRSIFVAAATKYAFLFFGIYPIRVELLDMDIRTTERKLGRLREILVLKTQTDNKSAGAAKAVAVELSTSFDWDLHSRNFL